MKTLKKNKLKSIILVSRNFRPTHFLIKKLQSQYQVQVLELVQKLFHCSTVNNMLLAHINVVSLQCQSPSGMHHGSSIELSVVIWDGLGVLMLILVMNGLSRVLEIELLRLVTKSHSL